MSDSDRDPCPVCSRALRRVERPFGLLWACDRCGVAYATLPVVRRLLSDTVETSRLHASSRDFPEGSMACPFCRRPQAQTTLALPRGVFRLPYCRVCRAFRLDREVLQAIRIPLVSAEVEATREIEARQKVALLSLIRSLETARTPPRPASAGRPRARGGR